MKTVLRLALCILLLMPAIVHGQTTPSSTPGFTISTRRPPTMAEYLQLLADSIQAMEGRLTSAINDSVQAAVSGTVGDSTAAMRSELLDSLNTIKSRLQTELEDSLAAADARQMQLIADEIASTDAGALELRLEADSTRLDSLRLASAAQDDSLEARKADKNFVKAGNNITVTKHGPATRPDSVTIASTASGGGGGGAKLATIRITLPGGGGDLQGADADSLLNIALPAVRDSANAKLIQFGPGVFTFSDSAYVRASNTVIRGVPGTVFSVAGAICAIVDTTGYDNLRVENIEWRGDAAAIGAYAGYTGSDSLVVRLCSFKGFSAAAAKVFVVDTTAKAALIENNLFEDCTAVYWQGRFATISNNRFYRSTTYGIYTEYIGVVIRGNGFYNCKTGDDDRGVVNCKALTPGITGMDTGPQVVDNTFFTSDSAYASMIYLDGSASNNDFIGYVISGNRQMSNSWGRYVRGICVVQQNLTGTRSIISNNHLTACTQYGIYLSNCNAFIAGNNLSGPGGGAQGTGIWLDYSFSVVSNNYVSYFITGLHVAGGVKSGYDNLWCSGVTTNVTDGGTSTVAGTVRDLD